MNSETPTKKDVENGQIIKKMFLKRDMLKKFYAALHFKKKVACHNGTL